MTYKYVTEFPTGASVHLPKNHPITTFKSQWLTLRNVSDEQSIQLSVPSGYAWDGCTMAPDWPWNKRASLFHDALYQFAGQHELSREECDYVFFEICLQDSTKPWHVILASLYYSAVRIFGGYFWAKRIKNGT